MTRVLFLFLDGIGLGEYDQDTNPFVKADLPHLNRLLGGQPLTVEAVPTHGELASLLALDANLGVPGTPQSASGQAVLLTGRNVPQEIGGHYGPKPNPRITKILKHNNLFLDVVIAGKKAGLINAYPPGYFHSIDSGRRLYSAIPLAFTETGLPLMTADDLQRGQALSVDFTGEVWSAQPGFPPAPIYTHREAGERLAEIARSYDLAFFDFWPSDYAGHRRDMEEAVTLLESFDQVLGALVDAWDHAEDLILLTSDHGNLEDLGRRAHTNNPVPCLLVGPQTLRVALGEELSDLTDVAPALRRILNLPDPSHKGS